MSQQRPTGVTIICILSWLGALFQIVVGGALAIAGGMFAAVAGSNAVAGLLGGLAGIIGTIFVILGIISIIFTILLWQMKKIGWTVVIILNIIGLIMSLVSLNLIGIIISAIIVYYLYKNRALFK